MPKNIPKDLENAILSLAQKEKNRHLLRLISRNDLLREQMQFNLLEDESDLVWRKDEIRELIRDEIGKYYSHTGVLLRGIRKVSSKITWHRRVTKDKYGEADLALLLLETSIENHSKHLDKAIRKADSLRVYLVKKAIAVLKYIAALEQDYHIDFEERMNKVLSLLHTFGSKYQAQLLNLPKAMLRND